MRNPLTTKPLHTQLLTTLVVAGVVSAVTYGLLNGFQVLEGTPTASAEATAVSLHPRPALPSITYENITIKSGDTLAGILASRGHASATTHQIVSSGRSGAFLGNLKAGKTLEIGTDQLGNIVELSYEPDPLQAVSIKRTESGSFEGIITEKQTQAVTRFADGKIDDSLFASGKRAGVNDTTILAMADAFSYDIDFALEVQPGDSFKVLYEEVLVDGKKIGDGPVLAAEFVNQGKSYRAVRFVSSDGRAGFYTPEGVAMRKAFLRTPVDFARISSRYTTRRLHPVLNTVRAHRGVDYAAARGTPVRATGNGRIEFAGNKGGYGRVLIIRHQGNQSTLYAHLNGFAKNIRVGARVDQGQIIAFVGSTGLASGPHLHYEFRVNGAHVDPLKVKTSQAEPIAASERSAFLAESARLVSLLESRGGNTAIARVDSDTSNNTPRQL